MLRVSAICCFVLLNLVTEAEQSKPSSDFDVFRLAQYDKNKIRFGSRRTNLNLLATTLGSGDKMAKPGDLARKVVVISMYDLTIKKLWEIIDVRRAGGLLVLLPKDLSQIEEERLNGWKEIEQAMLGREIKLPIYFSYLDERLQKMLDDLDRSSVTMSPSSAQGPDSYQLVVTGAEATPLSSISMRHFQGWLQGESPGDHSPGRVLPTIAFVAHYDSFGAAPDIATGSDSNGSGVVAVLELARLFSSLYKGFRTHGSFNFLFVLTGAGRLNYAGTKDWLNAVDSRILDSLQFVLCLDSLAAGNDLFLHVSKPAKDPTIKKLYASFQSTASAMSIPFEIVHKKINISHPEFAWEHEQFCYLKRIVAATLSHHRTPTYSFSRSSIFDGQFAVKRDVLQRNVKFIAEAIARHVYGMTTESWTSEPTGKESVASPELQNSTSTSSAIEIVHGSSGINADFMDSWMDVLGSTARDTTLMTETHVLTTALEEVLKQYTSDASTQVSTLSSPYTFFSRSKAKMHAYRVKPVTFDIFFSLFVGLYVLALNKFLEFNGVIFRKLRI